VARARPGANFNLLADTAAFDPLSGNAVLTGIPVRVGPVGGDPGPDPAASVSAARRSSTAVTGE